LTPKVIDFGLSAILLDGDWRRENYGTVAYCSPEITASQPHNQSTDIWSLGIVMYTLLSKRLPFIVPNLEQTISNIQTREISFALSCWVGKTEMVRDLIGRMLCKNKF
jgi:serine/threonine protein kinase